jgi:ADP-L-glycero-D-manno-heptose 6-epimerase
MIAVTGGAGFIGSALVWGLNAMHYDNILIVDNPGSDERWKNLVGLRFADISSKDDFLRNLESGALDGRVDGILHMGACSDTTETDVDFLLENNYRYTQRLAKCCAAKNIRFLYASSAATYGDGNRGFVDNETAIDSLRPLNIYGYSKQLFDLWAKREGMLSKIVGVKYFNVFGPNEYHKNEMRSVVHKAFGQIAATGKIKLFKSYRSDYADGRQLRDFIYIKDAVDATLYLFNRNFNGLFNIGTGKARSFRDLAVATFDALGKEVNIEFIDMPEQIRDKYQYFTQSDSTKLLSTGCPAPQFELERAIGDYVKNYLLTDNPYLGNEK